MLLLIWKIIDYCRIKYSFDGNLFIQLKSYQGNDNIVPHQILDEELTFDTSAGSQLHIQLETDGDSTKGDDYCYFQNVYLYGHGTRSPDVQLFYDSYVHAQCVDHIHLKSC